MEIKECIKFIEMLRRLPKEKQWEIYFMTKGAAGAALVEEKG